MCKLSAMPAIMHIVRPPEGVGSALGGLTPSTRYELGGAVNQSTSIEVWAPIKGFESWYEISTLGRVRRKAYTALLKDGTIRHYRELLRKTPVASHGYQMVGLTDSEGGHRNYTVHRLMARTFLGLVSDSDVVRHLNDVRTDNRLENLAVGSHSENRFDSVRNGSHVEANKTHCVHGHEFTPGNIYRRPSNPNVRHCVECRRVRSREFKSRRKAERDGIV